MIWLVQPRLINGPFDDPGLFLDFRFGRRAIMFDLGDLSGLSSREIVRLSHVCVSHMHMDHFAGFETLLRLNLYQPKTLTLIGPPGLAAAVQSKLAAYQWNLLDQTSADFTIVAADWGSGGWQECRAFRARNRFRPEVNWPRAAGTHQIDDDDFTVSACTLDHGVPSLAFAFQERLKVNVHKVRLDELGLPVGPWLTLAKQAARARRAPETTFNVAGNAITLGELDAEKVLSVGPGPRIVYATDFGYTDENRRTFLALVQGADVAFVESRFLDSERAEARHKFHLTAAQAGALARKAGVKRATNFHFSPRYLGREDELENEFVAAFKGVIAPAP